MTPIRRSFGTCMNKIRQASSSWASYQKLHYTSGVFGITLFASCADRTLWRVSKGFCLRFRHAAKNDDETMILGFFIDSTILSGYRQLQVMQLARLLNPQYYVLTQLTTKQIEKNATVGWIFAVPNGAHAVSEDNAQGYYNENNACLDRTDSNTAMVILKIKREGGESDQKTQVANYTEPNGNTVGEYYSCKDVRTTAGPSCSIINCISAAAAASAGACIRIVVFISCY
jgi:hypothetical protein